MTTRYKKITVDTQMQKSIKTDSNKPDKIGFENRNKQSQSNESSRECEKNHTG